MWSQAGENEWTWNHDLEKRNELLGGRRRFAAFTSDASDGFQRQAVAKVLKSTLVSGWSLGVA